MRVSKVLLSLVYALMIVACQSTPPPEVAPEPVPVEEPVPEVTTPEPAPEPVREVAPDRLEVSRDGFSPLASPPNHTLLVSIQWGNPTAVVEWSLAFQAEGSEPVRTIRGTETRPTVEWDGKTDAGVLAPQARYQAVLSTAGADGVLTEKARSLPVLLDLVPPSGKILVEPSPYVVGSTLSIELELVSGASTWTTWRLAVLHPDGRRFRDFINENYRDNKVVWDGRALNNAELSAGVTYQLEVEVFDVYGNRGVLTGALPVVAPPAPIPDPITISVRLDNRELASLPLYFAPYTADLERVEGTQKESNERTMARLAELLLEAPGTKVHIIGHANQVLFHDPLKAAYEQRETLLPLSLARAEAVKRALAAVGVPALLMRTSGVGATDPVAEFSDPENRWKNRRVVLEVELNGANN